jgi:transposase
VLAAKRERRAVFVEDESTFSLKPYSARGWYLRNEKPIALLTNRPHDRFYAFGVANGSKEHFRFFDGRTKKKRKICINSRMTVAFLRYMHSKYPKLLLIWDEASNHTARLTRNYAAKHDIKLLSFPTASPELNPEENVWAALKMQTANTFYEGYDDYLYSVKRKSRQKDLTKMFKYIGL